MKIIKGYTPIYNNILTNTQVSLSERLLFCILIMHCGPRNHCSVSQFTLGKEMGRTPRHARSLLKKLIDAGLVSKKRRGFNQSNIYILSEEFIVKRDRNSTSSQRGSMAPFYKGGPFPPKSIYLKVKDKSSSKGFERLKKVMEERGLKKTSLLNSS